MTLAILLRLLAYLRALWRRALKELKAALIRWYFGVGKVETVLRNGAHSGRMTKEFGALARSSPAFNASSLIRAGLFGRDDTLDAVPTINETATAILEIERIRPDRPNFYVFVLPNLMKAISGLREVARVCHVARGLASTPYSSSNGKHEVMLHECWSALGTGALTKRISADWQELGFQGTDPATDFRASGELGLRALHHFSSAHAKAGRAIIGATDLPLKGYPLALALIGMAMLALELAGEGLLDAYLGDASAGGVDGGTGTDRGLRTLLEVASQLQLLFDDAWHDAVPASVMEYNRVFGAFQKEVRRALTVGDREHRSSSGRLPVPRRFQVGQSQLPGLVGSGRGIVGGWKP